MEEQVINEEKNEKSLSLGELLFLAKKNWLVIAIITLACTIIGAIYGLCIKESSYTATNKTMVMVDVNKKIDQSVSQEYTAYMFSTYLINTYKSILYSNDVIYQAKNTLNEKGYNVDYNSIVNNLEFSSEENSLVVSISYTAHGDDKYQEAIDVVNAVVQASIDVINNKVDETTGNKKYPEILSNCIITIDKAYEAQAKRGAAIIIIVSFLVGLFISFAICLIKHLSDDTFKSKDDFKRILGVDIIATIPEINEAKGDTK